MMAFAWNFCPPDVLQQHDDRCIRNRYLRSCRPGLCLPHHIVYLAMEHSRWQCVHCRVMALRVVGHRQHACNWLR